MVWEPDLDFTIGYHRVNICTDILGHMTKSSRCGRGIRQTDSLSQFAHLPGTRIQLTQSAHLLGTKIQLAQFAHLPGTKIQLAQFAHLLELGFNMGLIFFPQIAIPRIWTPVLSLVLFSNRFQLSNYLNKNVEN